MYLIAGDEDALPIFGPGKSLGRCTSRGATTIEVEIPHLPT
jgi:hypothetical protein